MNLKIIKDKLSLSGRVNPVKIKLYKLIIDRMRFTKITLNSISTKITLGVSFIILILTFVCGLAIYDMTMINNNVSNIYENHLVSLVDIEKANLILIKRESAMKNIIMADNQEQREKFKAETFNLTLDFEVILVKLKNSNIDGSISKQIQENFQALKTIHEEAYSLALNGNLSEAKNKVFIGRTNINNIEKMMNDLIKNKEESAKFDYENSVSQFKSTRTIIIYAILISSIIGFIISSIIAKLISKPVIEVSKKAERIAQGDLNIELVSIKNKDEIGILAESFNKLLIHLKEIVTQIEEASYQVASSSEGLSTTAEENSHVIEQISNNIKYLAQGSENQVKNIIEANKTVKNIIQIINEVVENVKDVNISSIKMASVAKEGLIEVDSAINTINNVKNTTNNITGAVKKLSNESKEIGQIVGVIKNIADQTNLLALNAAIEAARAGEKGRGFSVVADEVRKLAEDSGKSAQKIAQMVSNVQSEISKVVGEMENGNKEVTGGVVTVNKAGTSFKVIVDEIEKVVLQLNEVTQASHQMSSYTSNVLVAMDNVSNISQQNAASTQEVSETTDQQTVVMHGIVNSAQKLAGLSEGLQRMIDHFRL